MLIKAGVDISQLERNTRRGLGITSKVFSKNQTELVVTSTDDGNHGAGSLHYADQAFDVRKPGKLVGTVTRELKIALGKDFDVILEGDHIHIEFDPK